LLGFALRAPGALLWHAPGPWLAHDNGAGADVLRGAVKPQDDTSSSTLYFKFTVDPLADVTIKSSAPFVAGVVLYERGAERLGVGNGQVAHAYSTFNASGRGLRHAPVLSLSGKGEFDLNAAYKGSKGDALEFPHRGEPRTILFRVQYVPGGDDQVTVWFQPELTPGNTEVSQLPGQITRFMANAAFDQLHLIHRGGGDGWRFSDLAIATSFDDFVAPHFWQRGWVIGAGVLLLLGVTGGAVWLVQRRRGRRHLQRLERAHALDQERTRIAQDLHDDLGVRLTEMLLLAEQGQGPADDPARPAAALQQIAAVVRETVQMADGIVWAVNPHNDTLHHLANYLVQFAENFFRLTPIRCRLDVPVQLPPVHMSSELRHHLLLAVKEACHNAARHSGATELWLRLAWDGVALSIAIEDNGGGFDAAAVAERGNGLRNLRARLASAGGRVELATAPGQGTRIRLVVPLPQG